MGRHVIPVDPRDPSNPRHVDADDCFQIRDLSSGQLVQDENDRPLWWQDARNAQARADELGGKAAGFVVIPPEPIKVGQEGAGTGSGVEPRPEGRKRAAATKAAPTAGSETAGTETAAKATPAKRAPAKKAPAAKAAPAKPAAGRTPAKSKAGG